MNEKKDGDFIGKNETEKERTELTADETPETVEENRVADNADRLETAGEDERKDAGQTEENTEMTAEAAETAAAGTAGKDSDLSAEEEGGAPSEAEDSIAADMSSGTYAEAASGMPYYEPSDHNFGPEMTIPAKTPLSRNKKILIAVIIAAVVVAAIIVVNVVRGSVFDRMTDQILDQFPYADNARATDGSYLKLDTNPYDKGFDDMSYTELSMINNVQSDTLEAIQYVNKELGFTDALYSKMMETSALMGRQTDENNKYRVSWTYHPDSGLEVVYEIK